MAEPLKAPFPYFGGKSAVADLVWLRLGDVDNYVEPFFGSGAVLLRRPCPPRVETANDLDHMVANFWRATSRDPEAVASFADGPVSECDLHSRHRWLVLSEDAKAFRERMRADPEFFDAKVAGWWCWGLCCWIGSGWCVTPDSLAMPRAPRPTGNDRGGNADGVLATHPASKVRIAAHNRGSVGKGVHAQGEASSADWEQRPVLNTGRGVHPASVPAEGSATWCQMPKLHGHASGCVPEAAGLSEGNRPQLADTYSRGRGVHGNDDAGTCAQRRAWLLDWFSRLRDRLRSVRVCYGDWSRVVSSDSVTTRLGLTGVFLDPPYSKEAKRCNKLYAQESGTVAHDVRRWCLGRGADLLMRIALAGYEGEGHEELEAAGWRVVDWKSPGGYGNRSEKGKKNRRRERLWFSPHCVFSAGLFDSLAAPGGEGRVAP